MRDSNGRPCPAVSELARVQTWAVKGERLPACCSEAKEADGGRRDTERQISRTAPDALRYTTAAAAVVVVVVTASTELDLAVVVGFEGAVAALRPARQRPAVNWRTGYSPTRHASSVGRRGERATGGERLPSELRQDEQANTATGGRVGKRVGITTWAQPGQRTLDQEQQRRRQSNAARARGRLVRLLGADWPEGG